jgi:hypothetical protein
MRRCDNHLWSLDQYVVSLDFMRRCDKSPVCTEFRLDLVQTTSTKDRRCGAVTNHLYVLSLDQYVVSLDTKCAMTLCGVVTITYMY